MENRGLNSFLVMKNLRTRLNESQKVFSTIKDKDSSLKITLRRTKKEKESTLFSRGSSRKSTVNLESIRDTNRDAEIIMKKFKPSLYAKLILDKIIPENKLKKNKLGNRLNRSVNLVEPLKKRKLSKVTEENEDLVADLNEKCLQRNHSAKLRKRINELSKSQEKKCDHQYDNPFIEQFLTPVNKFISKDFKIDFSPILGKLKAKKVRQIIPLSNPLNKFHKLPKINNSDLPPIPKPKKVN